MTMEILQAFLGWCLVFNFSLLIIWFVFFTFAHRWVYRMHSLWFDLSVERFDQVHYSGMAFYKLMIIIFNLVPYLALLMILPPA
ncbi:hypothetical protein P8629_08950 [Hydrogenovibrio sp. 3SP14C1]|uniref:DUF6868 family protein n=1 Tax=Hydrogenovibrio sp. 3SP14C1 TaxID=3038774 RepID=UPI0024170542|nr:hypothetical protein [Hydrogenovibrio sp. 3SP14C1]MDG4813131.1 hypothetical protein [Hydrogenovibrio sp. 3SP14C1]